MKTALLIILTLVTIEATAQNQFFGVKGGASWANVNSNFANKTDHRGGVTGGITYEYFLRQRFSVGAEAVYHQRGFTISTEVPVGEKATTDYRYNYLSIPIKAGFTNLKGGNKVFTFVKAGIVPSLLLNAKTKTPTFDDGNRISGTKTVNVTDRVSTFDLAGLAEIGGGYHVAERLWLIASFAYQHSLTSISNAEYFEDIAIRHRGMVLNIELKWALKDR